MNLKARLSGRPGMFRAGFLLIAALVSGCVSVTYLELAGPGKQHDSWCGTGILDTMTIQLSNDTSVHVASRIDGTVGWLVFNFSSLRNVDLKVLSAEIQLRPQRFKWPESITLPLAYAGTKGSAGLTPGTRERVLDDQPIVGATYRAFGYLQLDLVYELSTTDLPADVGFPDVLLGGRPVNVAPIHLALKHKVGFGLCAT